MNRTLLKIHQTNRFHKQFTALPKSGKIERIVARRAGEIIADLQTDPLHEKAECRRTRHGELRLRGCRKYNLSCGFRLIGLRRKNKLIFTYIGSHDDCQRWIENNRENQEEIESTPVPMPSLEVQQKEIPFKAEPEIDEYEEQLMARIDERMLLEIFAGAIFHNKKEVLT